LERDEVALSEPVQMQTEKKPRYCTGKACNTGGSVFQSNESKCNRKMTHFDCQWCKFFINC